jgi:hypothetical protein
MLETPHLPFPSLIFLEILRFPALRASARPTRRPSHVYTLYKPLTPQATSRWTAHPRAPPSRPDRNATNAADSDTLPVPAPEPAWAWAWVWAAGSAVVVEGSADLVDRAGLERGRGCRRRMRMGRL